MNENPWIVAVAMLGVLICVGAVLASKVRAVSPPLESPAIILPLFWVDSDGAIRTDDPKTVQHIYVNGVPYKLVPLDTPCTGK